MLVSSLALFVALGGTSYAAIVLPKNSVGSAQIKSNAVRGSEVASGAVTSSEVKSGSLLREDFKLGELPVGPAGAQGAPGRDGSAGAAGPKGDTGASGANGANGAAGANGTNGAAGPRGPSDAYYTPIFDSEDELDGGELTTDNTVIQDLVLPAGNYTIAVSALVFGTSSSVPIDATCRLIQGPDETGTILATTGFDAAADTRGAISIDSVITIPVNGGSVNLSCQGSGSEALSEGRIIATQVATLTRVPALP